MTASLHEALACAFISCAFIIRSLQRAPRLSKTQMSITRVLLRMPMRECGADVVKGDLVFATFRLAGPHGLESLAYQLCHIRAY